MTKTVREIMVTEVTKLVRIITETDMLKLVGDM